MTHDEWVQQALDACIEQRGTLELSDGSAEFIADLFLNADRAPSDRRHP